MRQRIVLLVVLVLALSLAGQALAIQRAAPRMNMVEFRGGYGKPLGDYDAIVGLDFRFDPGEIVSFDADRVYNDGFYFGLSYGQIVKGRWLFSVGADYARNKVENPIEQDFGDYIYSIEFVEDPTYSQSDISLKGQYLFMDLKENSISPFVGLGIGLGLSTLSSPGFESESDWTFSAVIDFGVDIKIWQESNNRSYLTLSSINSWDFAGGDSRAKLLKLGGGFRYFFKP